MRQMADQEDVDRANQGKEVWNAWALDEIAAGRSPSSDFSNASLDLRSFDDFVFPGNANFSSAKFNSRATFKNARFFGQAIFKDAAFLRRVYFTEAVFEKGFSFARAHFFGHFGFAKVQVKGNGTFQDCVFEETSKFDDSNFSDLVDWLDAKFSLEAHFLRAVFGSEAKFSNATFCNRASFFRAQFMMGAIFSATTFKGITTNLTFVHFRTVPDFRTTKFDFPPNFQGTEIDYRVKPYGIESLFHCAAGSEYAARYRRLKQLAAEAKDHEKELEFFAYELKAKRFYETRDFGPILLNVAYDWLSNYGRSVARPMLWLVLIVALSAVSLARENKLSLDDAWEKRDAILVVAGTNCALFLGAEKSDLRKKALEVLKPKGSDDLSLSREAVAYFQSAISLLLMFLIGLALRNRFRVGGGG